MLELQACIYDQAEASGTNCKVFPMIEGIEQEDDTLQFLITKLAFEVIFKIYFYLCVYRCM